MLSQIFGLCTAPYAIAFVDTITITITRAYTACTGRAAVQALEDQGAGPQVQEQRLDRPPRGGGALRRRRLIYMYRIIFVSVGA